MMKAEEALALANKYTDTHGGGGGTSDYSQLSNKPSINDVTLTGNKSSADLGLMDHYDIDDTPTEDSENLVTSGGVWSADKNINNKLQGSKQASSTSGTIEIPDYGMTESIDMYFKPTQDLHGYDKPWAGGAGKNKLPLVLSDIKTLNINGTWAGNEYTYNGIVFEILTGDNGTVTGIKVKSGTASANTSLRVCNNPDFIEGTSYIMNGTPATGSGSTYRLQYSNNVDAAFEDYGNGVSFTEWANHEQYMNRTVMITVFNGYSVPTGGLTFYPMIRLSTESDADFAPYSNICPISGQDNATFSWTDDEDIETEVSMNFGNTYYGGFCQFATGAIYSEWDYIASYNGETLSGEWVSDRDEYRAGRTPTIGAEVAYKTTPTMAVVRKGNMNLTDDYPIQFNGWLASVTYQPKNTVLEKAKQYTNQKISALGFPTPPTTDGTYHLECSVSSGIPTIRWVSNS